MFTEDDLLPLSGLQHLMYCERQWALIHVEQQWEENRLTAEGRVLHQRVHDAGSEARSDLVVARGLHIRSFQMGLSGQADAVEFHQVEEGPPLGSRLEGREGWWRPFPVEYKRGRPKPDAWDEVQLCAQALCLEEMLNVALEEGALFYGAERRRHDVALSAQLRTRTEDLARHMHRLYGARITPPPVFGPKCDKCSLINRCLPEAISKRSVGRYMSSALRDREAG
jgi:CRISPR-associated exonuclease Cas4